MKILEFERPIHEIEEKILELRLSLNENPDREKELRKLEEQAKKLQERVYSNLTPWQKVEIARHPDRPHTADFIEGIAEDFIEVYGDRLFRDDPAIVGGLARIDNLKLVIIGQEKGRDTKDKMKRNWGMPHPEGYRKAKRLMLLAEKFSLPVLTLVDTPGAFPGIGAEERGQAMAIADNLFIMLSLKVPILTFIIGEGGSGGALAIGLGDRVLALKYSIYSVISPEGCASILWRDGNKKEKAAEALKITAEDMLSLGIIDDIIEEPTGGAHRDRERMMDIFKNAVKENLGLLSQFDTGELLNNRRERYKRMGILRE